MEILKQGILLNIHEYGDNDLICNVFFSTGEIYSLFCPGTQKPNSKNYANLKFFKIIEFEIFANEVKQKGKLKRATIIENISDEETKDFLMRFRFLKNIIMQFKKLNQDIFDCVINILKIKTIYDTNYLWVLILFKQLLIRENMFPKVRECARCGTQDNISSFSLKENGLLCKNCVSRYDVLLEKKTLEKIIKFFIYDNNWIILNLQFTQWEKKFLNSIFKNFLIDNLGINVFLLENII